jgi:hypothetical protein
MKMSDEKSDEKRAKVQVLIEPPPPAPKASLGREIVKGMEEKKKRLIELEKR